MKRTLIVMRHAKTEKQGISQLDFDRNLTERGKNDAAMMAQRLIAHGYKPDIIIASSANRTSQTAQIVAEHFEYDSSKIVTQDKLYLCQVHNIENAIQSLPKELKSCMLIGHNPSVSDFIYYIDSKTITTDIPTAGLVVFSFDGADWHNFTTQKKKLELIEYPKSEL